MSSLQNHISKHFRNEEVILESINYPKLAEHKKIHKNLEEEVDKLRKKLEKEPSNSIEIFHFLVDRIIVGHLIDYDSDFFPLARKSINLIDKSVLNNTTEKNEAS